MKILIWNFIVISGFYLKVLNKYQEPPKPKPPKLISNHSEPNLNPSLLILARLCLFLHSPSQGWSVVQQSQAWNGSRKDDCWPKQWIVLRGQRRVHHPGGVDHGASPGIICPPLPWKHDWTHFLLWRTVQQKYKQQWKWKRYSMIFFKWKFKRSSNYISKLYLKIINWNDYSRVYMQYL